MYTHCIINFVLLLHAAVQILYTGSVHWVATAYTDGIVYLCDSLRDPRPKHDLRSSVEIQLAMIYRNAIKDKELAVTSLSVQQQRRGSDCGLFAIAFAYHMARGDDVTKIQFNQSQMRQHLLKCFEDQKLSPFPLAQANSKRIKMSTTRKYSVPIFCPCKLPDSYDEQMVECNRCKQWYHFTCIGNPPRLLRKWFCSNCK